MKKNQIPLNERHQSLGAKVFHTWDDLRCQWGIVPPLCILENALCDNAVFIVLISYFEATVKKEVEKLVKDNAKSSQQKDSLIIQLQQTLIMLCQQQLQKFIPGSEQNFSEQTLSTLLQKGLLNQSDSSEV